MTGSSEGMTELRGERVVLRPMVAADAPRLREIHSSDQVAAWWGRPEDDFPFSDDPGAARLTIVVDGEIAGLIQFSEETAPDYRHARIDLFLAEQFQNRGLGTDALRTLVSHLLTGRGHHRITIDPALANRAAIRCYEKCGFQPVGVMRLAERDQSGSWRDVLLMELVVTPRA
jgi:aminoglycoside 6'-N-acetyltransferase